MSQGGSIKQRNTQQETLAPGDGCGAGGSQKGKQGLVSVVVKEEQGAGLGFEGRYEFRERGPSQGGRGEEL